MRRLALLALLLLPRTARASLADGDANDVYGQPSMTTGTLPTTAGPFTYVPASIASGPGSPVLYIAEPTRHRVAVISTGIPAGLFGQESFSDELSNRGLSAPGQDTLSAPSGIAFDALLGRFAIADTDNNRVVIGNSKTFAFVLGQPTFTTSEPGTAATSMRKPRGVALNGSRLYVADTDNHRILAFNLDTGSATAVGCYGQPDCTQGLENAGLSTSANTFKSPRDVAVDPLAINRYFVVDTGNHRVLERSGTTTIAVYGQLGSYTSAGPSLGGVGEGSLHTPVAVASDRSDGFWVVDQGHYRVVHFKRGVLIADRVLGQKDLWTATRSTTPTSKTFVLPTGVAVAANGDVFVADGGAARVLRFKFDCVAGACNDNNACTADTCSEETGCTFGPATEIAPRCAPYRCDVTNRVCFNSCAARPCSPGFTCTVNKRCVRVCSNALPCPGGGHCVDGTCCNKACTGKCEKCDLPGREGVCSSYSGKPKRPCATPGDCGGQCTGFNPLECEPLPTGFACGAESCRDGVERRRGVCDGSGTCTGSERACAPFTCGSGACLSSCRYDFDCADGARCEGGVCSTIRVSGQGCAHAGAVESTFAVWVMSVVAALIRRRRRSRVAVRAALS